MPSLRGQWSPIPSTSVGFDAMCANSLVTSFFGSLSFDCGLLVVLPTFIRKMERDIYVSGHVRRVRRDVHLPGHETYRTMYQMHHYYAYASVEGTEVRYFFHVSVVRGGRLSLSTCSH